MMKQVRRSVRITWRRPVNNTEYDNRTRSEISGYYYRTVYNISGPGDKSRVDKTKRVRSTNVV